MNKMSIIVLKKNAKVEKLEGFAMAPLSAIEKGLARYKADPDQWHPGEGNILALCKMYVRNSYRSVWQLSLDGTASLNTAIHSTVFFETVVIERFVKRLEETADNLRKEFLT